MLSFILLSTLPVRCREDWVCNGFQDWSNVMIIVYILHQTFSQTLGVHKKIRCLCHKILIIPWKYMREGRRSHKIVQKEGPVVHETGNYGWKKEELPLKYAYYTNYKYEIHQKIWTYIRKFGEKNVHKFLLAQL